MDDLRVAFSLGIATGIDHSRCHRGTCERFYICPTCQTDTFIRRIHGRWDHVRNDGAGATATPFDPVAVTLECGHIVGDYTASQPEVTR